MKKCWKTLLAGAALLVFVGFLVYKNYSDISFWDASALNCASLIVAVVISYFLVERRSDMRKQKEIVANLLVELKAQIDAPEMISMTGQTAEDILMRNRNISNRIAILEKIQATYSLSDDVSKVKNWFDEYNSLVGNHIHDLSTLCNMGKDLERPLGLISSELISISLTLYQ